MLHFGRMHYVIGFSRDSCNLSVIYWFLKSFVSCTIRSSTSISSSSTPQSSSITKGLCIFAAAAEGLLSHVLVFTFSASSMHCNSDCLCLIGIYWWFTLAVSGISIIFNSSFTHPQRRRGWRELLDITHWFQWLSCWVIPSIYIYSNWIDIVWSSMLQFIYFIQWSSIYLFKYSGNGREKDNGGGGQLHIFLNY